MVEKTIHREIINFAMAQRYCARRLTCQGAHQVDSDIDLGLYYISESFDLTSINQLVAVLDDEQTEAL